MDLEPLFMTLPSFLWLFSYSCWSTTLPMLSFPEPYFKSHPVLSMSCWLGMNFIPPYSNNSVNFIPRLCTKWRSTRPTRAEERTGSERGSAAGAKRSPHGWKDWKKEAVWNMKMIENVGVCLPRKHLPQTKCCFWLLPCSLLAGLQPWRTHLRGNKRYEQQRVCCWWPYIPIQYMPICSTCLFPPIWIEWLLALQQRRQSILFLIKNVVSGEFDGVRTHISSRIS